MAAAPLVVVATWVSGKAELLCGLFPCTVECWFQEDLVFVVLKEKSKPLPGLGNRKSLFWVSSWLPVTTLRSLLGGDYKYGRAILKHDRHVRV